MALIRVESNFKEGIEQYIFGRQVGLNPGKENIDRAERGQIPAAWVKRRLVFFEVISIPVWGEYRTLPAEVALEHPIPVRFSRNAHHH